MKTRILIAFMMAGLFISSAALAQRPAQKKERTDNRSMVEKQEMKRDFRHYSFLTDEQKEAVKKIRMETAKEIIPLKNELNELQAHQQTLATSDNVDMKAIYKNIDKMSEVKAKMAKIRAKQQQEIRSLLTEEQLLKMDQRRSHIQRGERPFARNRLESRNRHTFGNGA